MLPIHILKMGESRLKINKENQELNYSSDRVSATTTYGTVNTTETKMVSSTAAENLTHPIPGYKPTMTKFKIST